MFLGFWQYYFLFVWPCLSSEIDSWYCSCLHPWSHLLNEFQSVWSPCSKGLISLMKINSLFRHKYLALLSFSAFSAAFPVVSVHKSTLLRAKLFDYVCPKYERTGERSIFTCSTWVHIFGKLRQEYYGQDFQKLGASRWKIWILGFQGPGLFTGSVT